MKIIAINHGISCRIGENIYYNKKLKKYPELLKAILKHENRHTSGFTLKDIKMDLKNKELIPVKKQYYKFILEHPSSWTEFLPFGIYRHTIVFNPLMIFMWLVLVGVIWLFTYLLN